MELTRAVYVVDIRIVSVSESELIVELMVDIVRSDAMLEALSESDCEDAPMPISCLCDPQWI